MADVMKAFDDTGDGEIDFRKFCELVMGSSRTTANSLGIGQLAGTTTKRFLACGFTPSTLSDTSQKTALHTGRGNFVSADGGNSDMMIVRCQSTSMQLRVCQNSSAYLSDARDCSGAKFVCPTKTSEQTSAIYPTHKGRFHQRTSLPSWQGMTST